MVKQNDTIEFIGDFVYSTILFDAKLLRQVVKIGKGSCGKVALEHKHGRKTFYTVDITKPKDFEIINITRQGKFKKTKKFDKLLPDIASEDLKKIVKVKFSPSRKA